VRFILTITLQARDVVRASLKISANGVERDAREMELRYPEFIIPRIMLRYSSLFESGIIFEKKVRACTDFCLPLFFCLKVA